MEIQGFCPEVTISILYRYVDILTLKHEIMEKIAVKKLLKNWVESLEVVIAAHYCPWFLSDMFNYDIWMKYIRVPTYIWPHNVLS